MQIILASASPRRRTLIKKIVADPVFMESTVKETLPENVPPEQAAMLLAEQKALACLEMLPEKKRHNTAMIGCDTMVVCDGNIFGKPKDSLEAADMLHALSGRTHEVITGVCVLPCTGRPDLFFERTQVRFKTLSEADIQAYIETGEPFDKAGGYGIQGKGGALVDGITGDRDNVIGLPIDSLARHLVRLKLKSCDCGTGALGGSCKCEKPLLSL